MQENNQENLINKIDYNQQENYNEQDDKKNTNSNKDQMIELQNSIVNRLIKKTFNDKLVTSQFKKIFKKTLTLFILFIQNNQNKKKYGKNDILAVLEKQGFGIITEQIRKYQSIEKQISRKKIIQQENQIILHQEQKIN